MIRELKIENFRAFRELRLTGLGRVNLLVGANNSGKTSVLEAIAFLASGGDPWELYASLARRGEHTIDDVPSRDADTGLDVRHVFLGRKIGDDARLRVEAVTSGGDVIELELSTPPVPDEKIPAWRRYFSPRALGLRTRVEAHMLDLERSDRTPRYLRIVSTGTEPLDVALQLNGGLIDTHAITARADLGLPMVIVTTGGSRTACWPASTRTSS